MSKSRIPTDEELTEAQKAWRDIYDPNHLLNLNQIIHRLGKAEQESYRRNLEVIKNQRVMSDQIKESNIEDRHTDSKISIEKFLEVAKGISNKAGVDDLMSILQANMVLASQSMDLRPQDFISAIRMLKDIKKEEMSGIVDDPYDVEPMSDEEVCTLLVESIAAHIQIWRKKTNERRALWLIPFIEQLFAIIFTNAAFGGLVEAVSVFIDNQYYEIDKQE